MASFFNDLMSSFKDATSATFKKHDSSTIVKFLKSNIKKLNNILKTIDILLKKNNIDVSELYKKGVSGTKSFFNKGRKFFSEAKEKGFIKTAKEKTTELRSKITGIFKDSNETTTSPPEEYSGNVTSSKRKNWIQKLAERQKRRKDEVEAEKKAVSAKGKKSDGWLGKILSGITSLGSFLLTGFKNTIGFLGDYLLTGLGKYFTKALPWLSGKIAKGTSFVLNKALKLGGKGLLEGAKFIGKKAIPGALRAGLGIVARGAGMLLTGPVGLAVALGTGVYYGYKLFKYFKRNDISEDIYGDLTRLRFMMYGYDDSKKEDYHKLADLDMLMKDQVKFDKYKVTIKPLTEEVNEQILELFGVDPEDTEKYTILSNWFNKRYLPAFRSYIQALYSINNAIYLDDIDKLKSQDIVNFTNNLKIPLIIYKVKEVPFFSDINITVEQEQIEDLKSRINKQASDNFTTGKNEVTISVSKNIVKVKDNFATNSVSKLINHIEKSDNLAVKILRWLPGNSLILSSVKYLNNAYKGLNIYARLTKVRFMMYGYDDSLLDHYDKLVSLEASLYKYISRKDNIVTINNIPNKDILEFATLFNINSQQQYDLEVFNNWFNNRFIPAYIANIQTLYSINDKLNFETINKLKLSDVIEYLNKLIIPSEIFSVKILPTSDYAVSTIDMEEVKSYIDTTIKYAKGLSIATKVKDKAIEIFDKVKDKVTGVLGKVVDKAKNIGNKIIDKLSGIGSFIKDKIINPTLESLSNIGKFVVVLDTSNFEGEKIVKLFNIPMAGNLTRLRYMLYGLDSTKKEFYIKIANIEMLMSNYVTIRNNGPIVRQLDIVAKNKIFDILEIDKDDDDKFAILNSWFNSRFMPVYVEYLKALYATNSSITLDTINKLNSNEVYNFLTRLTIPESIYDTTLIPLFPDPKIIVTKEEIAALKNKLIADTKSSSTDKEQIKTTDKKQNTINKQNTFKPVNTSVQKVTKSNINLQNKNINLGTEYEPKPNITQQTFNNNTIDKVSNKLNKTTGEMYPGSGSLEGIVTKLPKEKIYNLDPNVLELFTGMAKEYNTLTGKSIPVNEAFRTFKDQQALYNKYPGKAAKPGNSTHEHGLAIDINQDVADELDKLGLLRKYGFTRPIGGEKWHLEPIGVSINPTLAKTDENAKYNLIAASPGKGGDGYGSLSNSILKRRNIKYQLSVYNKNNENIIDPYKLLDKNSSITPLMNASLSRNINTLNQSSRPTTAVYKPVGNTYTTQSLIKPVIEPSVQNTESYRTTISKNKQSTTDIQPQHTNVILDTKNIESLMSEQLSELKQIVAILTSINNKFDLDKINDLLNNKTQIKPLDKYIPKDSINLSNKPIHM